MKHGTADGSWEVGTAAYEKRGVEAFVPAWNKENCIQCNQCAYICPHAAIRPFVLTDDELTTYELKNLETLEMKAPAAMKGMHFVIEPSVLDCLGCGNCADICPGNPKLGKALTMVPFNPDAADMKKAAQDWLGQAGEGSLKAAPRRYQEQREELSVRTAAVRVLGRLLWLR